MRKGFAEVSYAATLFDLDGTLADTLEDLGLAMNLSLRCLGLPEHPVAAYRQFVGDGVMVLCERVLPAGRADLAPRLAQVMRENYARMYMDHTDLYPGIRELLGQLRSRGVAMAILSNKPDDFTTLMVVRLGIGECFKAVRGLRDGVPRKPAPDAALAIAHELGVPPERFLYVGDTATDMQTARAAGMKAVGVLWGFRDRQELQAAGAAHIIAAPAELVKIIDAEDGSR